MAWFASSLHPDKPASTGVRQVDTNAVFSTTQQWTPVFVRAPRDASTIHQAWWLVRCTSWQYVLSAAFRWSSFVHTDITSALESNRQPIIQKFARNLAFLPLLPGRRRTTTCRRPAIAGIVTAGTGARTAISGAPTTAASSAGPCTAALAVITA